MDAKVSSLPFKDQAFHFIFPFMPYPQK